MNYLQEESEVTFKWPNMVLFAARMKEGVEAIEAIEAIGEIERWLSGYEEQLPSYVWTCDK